MSEKNTAEQKSKINQKYIKDLIETHGLVQSIRLLKETLGENLDEHNPDRFLSLIIWQTTHSLDELEKMTGETFNHIGALHGFLPRAENELSKITAQTLIMSLDGLKKYINR